MQNPKHIYILSLKQFEDIKGSNYKTDEGIDLICGCNSGIYIFVSK
jgi:hypothetical protein